MVGKLLKLFGYIHEEEIYKILNEESEYYKQKRENLNNTEDILEENSKNRLSNYAQCCLDLRLTFLLKINKHIDFFKRYE